MSEINIETMKSVYKQFPWDSREEYRVLRKVRPDFDLPSDKVISRVWGSFSGFKEALKNGKTEEQIEKPPVVENISIISDESKKLLQDVAVEELDEETKRELLESPVFSSIHFDHTEYLEKEDICVDALEEISEEEKIVELIKQAFSSDLNIKRNEYRLKRSNNPELNLPSSGIIEKLFGSFEKLRVRLLTGVVIEDENIAINTMPEKEEDLDETERERAIRLARSIWNADDFTRGEYRDKKKSVPDIDLPSCDKISKLFGSFAQFKISIKEDFLSEDIDMNIDNPTPEEIEELKERVKIKRVLLFGNCRRAYEWEPIARKTRFGLSKFF